VRVTADAAARESLSFGYASPNPRPAIARPDLSPRPASALEWWFVQGRFEGARLGSRDFMLSLFRQSGPPGRRDGNMLLLATLDPASGQHATLSRVSASLVENFLREAPQRIRASELDSRIVSAYLDEIAEGGPPRPIRTDDAGMESAALSFSLSWKDVRLAFCQGQFEIEFALPDGSGHCRLTATPEAAWFEGRDLGGGGTGTMAYDCCPRLHLSGGVAGEAVTGEAWIDHQWGGHGWMQAPDGGSGILGWDWLGINLQDRRDILVMVHRDMSTRLPVAGFAVFFDPGCPPRIVHDVTVTTGESWTSPTTMIDYPLRRRIEIPSLAVDLEFAPTIAAQEIPVFGVVNAIWEGAGAVEGTVAGCPVDGRARLELHGYGYLVDYDAYMRRWTRRIDATLESFLPKTLANSDLEAYLGPPRWRYDAEAQTEMLSRPVWDLLSRGGKHWRPIFGLLLLDALGIAPGPYERMFSVVGELVHNGSVIVDDIEDQSLSRRGGETIHMRYGVPTAINAGNLLYFLPLLTIAETPELSVEQREAIYRVVFERFIQAHFGQAQDLYWSRAQTKGEAFWDDEHLGPLILQAYAFKTAAPVRAIADVACIIARPDSDLRETCVRLADSVGVAFQIVDDINNFGTEAGWGKVSGEDLAAGKVTYAIHKAVRLLEGADKRRLIEILDSPHLRLSAEGQCEGTGLIKASGALGACRREANELAETDWRALSKSLPASQSKIMLRLLFANLLALSFDAEQVA
jgi:geranylgeranyl pyrophosphate synthase/predicted secreted hydrolase